MTLKEIVRPTQYRSVGLIAADFKALLASRLPFDDACKSFELLWDETNASASRLLPSNLGHGYIALLRRMHSEFNGRYPRSADSDGKYVEQAAVGLPH